MVDSKNEAEATKLFGILGLNMASGQCILGGFSGNQKGKDDLVRRRVHEWIHNVKTLTKAAELQPQTAYAAFTKSLQFKWTHLHRLTPSYANALSVLWDTVCEEFIP